MPVKPAYLLAFVFIVAALLAVTGFYRSGNSLCWIAESESVRQIQFAPYYWHGNELRAAQIESVDAVPVPGNSDRRALRVSSARMELVYEFAHDGWIGDIEAFAAEVTAVAAGERRFACRIRAWTWVFAAALMLAIASVLILAGMAGRRMMRRRPR